MKTLYDICNDIAQIVQGLMYDEIPFTYEKIMTAMRMGHPAEILDEILSLIGWDVFTGRDPAPEKVKEMYERLIDFEEAFSVKELRPIIKELKAHISQ